MNKVLVNQLQNDFPEFFRDLYGDPRETCMSFGIETGDGWFKLLYKLCEDIKANNPPEEFVFSQIKEKFGRLTVYVSVANDEIYDLIDEAEARSYKICENCGDTENVEASEEWIRVRCANCREL